MKPCSDYQKKLYLDVYEELDLEERPAWERHLKTCTRCQEEREELLRLLQTVKATLPDPALSPDKVQALARSITGKLREEREEPWWQKQFLGIPQRLIPALATASLLIVVLSWISLKEFKQPAVFPTASQLTSAVQVPRKDLDVIKNLELLKEMDAIEKLVHYLDKSEAGSLSMKRERRQNQYGGGGHA